MRSATPWARRDPTRSLGGLGAKPRTARGCDHVFHGHQGGIKSCMRAVGGKSPFGWHHGRGCEPPLVRGVGSEGWGARTAKGWASGSHLRTFIIDQRYHRASDGLKSLIKISEIRTSLIVPKVFQQITPLRLGYALMALPVLDAHAVTSPPRSQLHP